MNDNQNFFVQAGRTTSRVSNQPGGRCSIMIGGWTEEELQKQRGEKSSQPEQEFTPTSTTPPEKENNSANVEEEKSEDKKEDEITTKTIPIAESSTTTKYISSNAFASGANMNSCNVLTDRPTSRVKAPPGGHCSIRLG